MPKRKKKIFEKHGSLEHGPLDYWKLRRLREERGKNWKEKYNQQNKILYLACNCLTRTQKHC